jgi:CBS domain-containing protein
MRAKDVMSDGVTSIAATATVYEAAKLLVNTRVSAMPVLDGNGIMIGIVSEADVIKEGTRPAGPVSDGLQRGLADDSVAAAAHAQTLTRQVAEIMTRDVVTADENASLSDIAGLMLKHHVKRVPILRDRKVVGVVSRADLLQALLSREPTSATSPTPTPAAPSDEALRAAVVAAVSGKSWSLARRADVVAKDGVVHLWGVVPSEAVLDNYGAAAGKVAGVKSVQVHMHVMQR